MCSILGILDLKTDAGALREQALRLSKLQRHRGPDWSGIYASENAVLAHERLAIVDIEGGAQPLYNAARNRVLAVNGEIYNHRLLARRLAEPYDFQTRSDCEIILALYEERGTDFLNELNGIFASCSSTSFLSRPPAPTPRKFRAGPGNPRRRGDCSCRPGRPR